MNSNKGLIGGISTGGVLVIVGILAWLVWPGSFILGLIIALIYIFWAAKGLGFYTATSIAFFILLSLYDPAPHGVLKSWVKRIITTACFMAVMYGLFALLLKVYTPREIFF